MIQLTFNKTWKQKVGNEVITRTGFIEKENSILFGVNYTNKMGEEVNTTVYLPKSQIKINNDVVLIPNWLWGSKCDSFKVDNLKGNYEFLYIEEN